MSDLYPDQVSGILTRVKYTTECGVWAVWRIKTGWVARWLRYEGKKK